MNYDKEEIDRLIKQAKEGDQDAHYQMGLKYLYDKGVLKDPLEALCWFQGGDFDIVGYPRGFASGSLYMSGLMLFEGTMPSTRSIHDDYEAKDDWKLGSELGHSGCSFRLGIMWFNIYCVGQQNYTEGKKYIKLA